MAVKGVIFDMDGTMYDSEKIWRDIWRHLPEEYGYPEDLTIGEDMCGTVTEVSIQVAHKHLPDEDPVEFVKRGRNEYKRRLFEAQPDEMLGLQEIIHYLYDHGYKLAVASGSDPDVINLNLKRGGMEPYFTTAVSGKDVEHGKPAPDSMLEAARRMGLKPEECIVIEDGENGIRSAVAAGCLPIMVPDLTAPSDEMKQVCVGIFDNLLEAMKAIDENPEW